MYFKDVIGQLQAKNYLYKTYKTGYIPSALLFSGPSGYGGLPLSLAYARLLICGCNTSAQLKMDKLQHPDLHFIFPTAYSSNYKEKKINMLFSKWRDFLYHHPYGNIFNWLEYIDNKQAQIGIEESKKIIKILHSKSYEGGYKVFILWLADRLHVTAANKILKVLEEIPKNNIFLFVGEEDKNILPTIRSRMQIIHLKPLKNKEMQDILQSKYNLSEKQASIISDRSEGNWGKAIEFLNNHNKFEEFFMIWIREVFIAFHKKKSLKYFIEFSEIIHTWGIKKQKIFLEYCIYIFRKALLTNYKIKDLAFNPLSSKNFNWTVFSSHLNVENIKKIIKEITKSSKDIKKNANAKIVFLDLSIHIMQYLHNIIL